MYQNEQQYSYAQYFNRILNSGPVILKNYIDYILTINGDAITTSSKYYGDLILFFRYVLLSRGKNLDFSELRAEEDYNKIVELLAPEVHEVLIQSIRRDDVISFLSYLKREKKNSTNLRNRRLASIRGFFTYADTELNIIDYNPVSNIHPARTAKRIPIYLNLEQAQKLLAAVPHTNNYARDYCILIFFLNLGLRISELVSTNISDIDNDRLKVRGKGSKERMLYFNEACKNAYAQYMEYRLSAYLVKKEYRDALFVSEQGRRLSPKRVYDIVMQCIELAGLSDMGFTPHKLRHTCATLMYQYGGVDIRALKDVLGHENIGTTQIYTHTNNQLIMEATSRNPLSGYQEEGNNDN